MRTLVTLSLFTLLMGPGRAVAQETAPEPPSGVFFEDRPSLADPTATYTLYLPTSLPEDHAPPALLVLDPRGRSRMAAELFQPGADELGWLLLSADDSLSDSAGDGNVKAFNALMHEAMQRFGADPKRIYLAGFSGTGNFSWDAARRTGAVAGVIATGSRFPDGLFTEPFLFSTFGAAGTRDFNLSLMDEAVEQLERWESPYRYEVFDGDHAWMPQPTATRAMRWMQVEAMRRGLAPRDPRRLSHWLEVETTEARALADDGHLLAALDRYRAIETTYADLAELSAVTPQREALENEPELKRLQTDRERWQSWEIRERRRADNALVTIYQTPPPSAPRLIRDLELDRLKQQAQRTGPGSSAEADAAGRILGHLRGQLGFYIRRELFAAGDYLRASTVLLAAIDLEPEAMDLWYDLACAHARRGRSKDALKALAQAIDFGFANRAHMTADPDLESLREQPEFVELVAQLAEQEKGSTEVP